jgi:Mrp family chromosome partitioning ATPase
VLHERFEVAVSSGLCEVLAHGVEWVKAVQGTRYGNLWLLPRGTARQDSSELFLAGGAMERLLECVASRYDYVLLDTPPVLAVDDVTNVAALVDTVLFVLRAEHTSGRVARAALELLYQRQAGVLGLVFNAVRPRSADYYYYSYPDHYGAYPAGGRQVK